MRFSNAALILMFLAVPAVAADNDNVNGRNWAATCTGCHGPNGRSDGPIPGLIGLQKAYIVMAMREFKEGTRQATVMHQHAKGYTDEQIERIAEYFAAQKLN
jgi:cytochrome subunit of sulfide dehydrogenase